MYSSAEDPLYHPVVIKQDQRFWKRMLIVDDDVDVAVTFKVGIEDSNNNTDTNKRIEVYVSNSPVSSDARKATAFAISSGFPILPSGTMFKTLFLNCSACSSLSPIPRLLAIGVAIGPGLMALARILWRFRSTVQERANDRIAALVAL
jgi:hypothetical protein